MKVRKVPFCLVSESVAILTHFRGAELAEGQFQQNRSVSFKLQHLVYT
jgi:hypothetical protein